jgi:hypothetical protein
MAEFTLEPTGAKNFVSCDCCGDNGCTVWPLVYRDGNAEAAYFVHWSLGKLPTHDPRADIHSLTVRPRTKPGSRVDPSGLERGLPCPSACEKEWPRAS